jgi:hypothetical protein
VRHWDTLAPYTKRNHLFLLPLDIDAQSRRLCHSSASGKIVSPADAVAGTAAVVQASAPYAAFDIMFNWQSDCPGKHAGADASSFAVSPDGSKIAFACRSTLAGGAQPHDMAWSTETSVFTCEVPQRPADGERAGALQAATAKISSGSLATKSCPVFSPCSRYVA